MTIIAMELAAEVTARLMSLKQRVQTP